MIQTGTVKRKPEKVLELDDSVTKIIVRRRVQGIKIEDEKSEKHYILQRTAKNGLQMTGA
jgi:hypothetical protein